MGRLTTHVLDVAAGTPARGMAIELLRIDGETRRPVGRFATNADGRCDAPLLEGGKLTAGVWELAFHVAAYYRSRGVNLPEPPFLDVVSVRFGIASGDESYHVPLLVSPWSYSTYRGS
jgi:5-hydroxyisourate hydrolase